VGGRWGQAAGFESIRLCDAALSGSGPDVKGEHIIDPRHGRPGRQHEASWVRCPSATLADALSTAFILMPEAAIKGYCEAHPQVEAFVVPCGSESGLTYLAGPKG
jgi:thiamine biosynthesis lipoprotein